MSEVIIIIFYIIIFDKILWFKQPHWNAAAVERNALTEKR